ncbi:LAMI_0G08460g1_1 [Lachancea mirantina]|uniref:LAMI_0G08460g1_1 n=1 Tax=Lachancea mirantina TaxID=1230905 RepID=A0A1G4K9Z3_9SACH|nr:LAMI_0G08460g1_1 [Lachancea mirantina]
MSASFLESMDNDNGPEATGRLELLPRSSQENETNNKPSAGTQLALLMDTLHRPTEVKTRDEIIQNTAYTDDTNGHYTSVFKARPHADYFDFDTEYNRTHGLDGGISPSRNRQPQHMDLDCEDNANGYTDQNAHFRGDQAVLQEVIDKLDSFKQDFTFLIRKMDDASLACRQAVKETSSTFSGDRPLPMSKIIKDIMDSLEDLSPSNASLTSQGENESTQTPRNYTKSGFLQTLSLASLEKDPCARMPNFGVILIKSPTSVSQLWDEYTKLPHEWPMPDLLNPSHSLSESNNDLSRQIMQRTTSIRELERKYGSSWRNNDKNFSRQVNRRKKIWGTIEAGLEQGISLQECFLILESYAKERGKGLSWYYNGIPFEIASLKGVYKK